MEVATEQNQASSLSLDEGFVYWANTFLDGSIVRCPLLGCPGPPTVLVAHQRRPMVPIADGKNLFWMNIVDEANHLGPRAAVMRCPIEACASATETMAVQAFSTDGMSMAMDRSDVYWVAQGTEELPMMGGYYPHATIYRRAK